MTHRERVCFIAGDAHPELARAIADELGVPVTQADLSSFADGESFVHVSEDVRDALVVLIQPTCSPVNDHLMSLALLADAVRGAGAGKVLAVVPYFGYARQDRRKTPGDACSAQVAAKLLGSVGIDHLITVDLHSPALECALPMPATLLDAADAVLPRIMNWNLIDPVVVSPDAGGVKRAQRFAAALNAPLAIVTKERAKPDIAESISVFGDVRERACLIVDDMASTGRTLRGAAEALRRAGARDVSAFFTHPVMSAGAPNRILGGQFQHLLTTNSIPIPSEDWLEVESLAPLLAKAIGNIAAVSPMPHDMNRR